MGPYATVEEYRADTGDVDTPDERIEARLAQQSAKLRALAGIAGTRALTADQLLMARELVCESVRRALVTPDLGEPGDVSGVTSATFSANGFSQSYQVSNPSGTAYFDRSALKALMRSLGTGQRAGTILPSYGRRRC